MQINNIIKILKLLCHNYVTNNILNTILIQYKFYNFTLNRNKIYVNQ